jgi:hypothetical protein
MEPSGWSNIIGSATAGVADIISAAKGNYSKTQNTVALGSNVTATGSQSSIVPLVLFGGLFFVVAKLFSKRR